MLFMEQEKSISAISLHKASTNGLDPKFTFLTKVKYITNLFAITFVYKYVFLNQVMFRITHF